MVDWEGEPVPGLQFRGGGEISDCLCGFLHRLSSLILTKEKAGSPFQDFLLGNAEAAVLISAYKI